jgi:flagellar M-ring protein FliF
MHPVIELFRKLGPVRVAALVGTGFAIIGFFIFLATRMSAGGMALLYSDLDPSDSGSIIKELDKKNIPYQIKAGGSQILVASEEVLNLRMSLASSGLPGGGSMGYELFDKSQGLGTTNFVQNINLVRALEGELSRTISSIRGVKGARVHLVLPRRELFSREKQKPSASVVLQLVGSNRLDREQVSAVQHLVAAAIPDLDPGGIAILDNRGKLLARGLGEDETSSAALQTSNEMRLTYENKMQRSIELLVQQVVGLDKVRAEVSAKINYDKITESAERYDPEGQVTRSTNTISENEESSQAADNQAVSVQNELPDDQQAAAAAPASNDSRRNRNEEVVNFEVSRTVTNTVKETGEIERLSVAVLVDGNYTEQQDAPAKYEPRSAEQLEQIETLVKSAIGYDANRGDTVEIVNMQFANIKPMDLDDGGSFLGLTKQDIMPLVEIIVLALVGALLVLFVVRPILTRLFDVMPKSEGSAATIGQDAAALQQLAGPDAIAAERLQERARNPSLLDQMIDVNAVEDQMRTSGVQQVSEIVNSHPEEAVAIVRNWIYQDQAR